ncbi:MULTISPECIES: hypothetical protein [Planktothricoides]|uniref:Uncharacterized protein n=2 Tax=Planktothricoides raciborskii TaxID=132608 RepID=A0AAU8JLR7_9CYAN|nr:MULTISPECIES: hypothetical protein [Planktothricoides]KOR34825.1 hypothetical protein AM228_21870 [Planktothricoides sp. SR001]MBD2545345.1 hypothetical protein [Planktothricoides raciborskii FACHB-1370]MBD2583230.1 hypothetical protein [Planktothricoides raciborskii FACHB-1261]
MGGEKETRFLGFWGGCWGKETGFLLWGSGVICGMRTRNPVSKFLGWLLGERNRVSFVNIKSYLWDAKKKPGFWGRLTTMSDSSE